MNAIRLLQAALNYVPEELDTPDEDVLRWESEGGVYVQVVEPTLPSEEGD